MPRSKIKHGAGPGEQGGQKGHKGDPNAGHEHVEGGGPQGREANEQNYIAPKGTQHMGPKPSYVPTPHIPKIPKPKTNIQELQQAGQSRGEKWVEREILRGNEAPTWTQTPNEKLDDVETWSGSTLPSEMVLALADSNLEGQDLKDAALALAREYELPMDWWTERFVDKNLPAKQDFWTDPRTGQPMTLKYAKNVAQKYEIKLFRGILEGMNRGAPMRDQAGPRADAAAPGVAAAMHLLSGALDTERIDFPTALGMAIQAEKDFGTNETRWKNYADNLKAVARYGSQEDTTTQVSWAHQSAMLGIKIDSAADVASLKILSDPTMPAEQKQIALAALVKAEESIKAGEVKSDFYVGKPQEGDEHPAQPYQPGQQLTNLDVPLYVKGKKGRRVINPAAFPQLEPAELSAIRFLQGDNDKFFDEVVTNSREAMTKARQGRYIQEAVADKLMPDVVQKWIISPAVTALRATEWAANMGLSGVYITGSTVGGTIAAATTDATMHDVMTHLKAQADTLTEFNTPYEGWLDTSFAELLERDGVPEPLAEGLEIVPQLIGLEPVVALGMMSKAAKTGRLVAIMAKAKSAATIVDIVKMVDEASPVFNGKSAVRWTIDAVDDAIAAGGDNFIRTFDRWQSRIKSFRGPGGRGLDPMLMEDIGNAVKGLRKSRAPESVVEDVVSGMLKGGFNLRQQGTFLDTITEQLHNARARRAALAAQKKVTGVAPQVADEAWLVGSGSAELDKAVQKYWEDVSALAGHDTYAHRKLTGGITANRMMYEIPHRGIRGFRAPRAVIDSLDSLMTRFAPQLQQKVRSGLSALPSPIADFEGDLHDFVVQLLRRSSVFDENEISKLAAQARNLQRPGTAFRETRLQALMEEVDRQVVHRLGKKYGLEAGDTEKFLKVFRDKQKEINAQLFGVKVDEFDDAVTTDPTKLIDIKDPSFETQLLNKWSMIDPLQAERAIKASVGLGQEFKVMAANVLGLKVPVGTIKQGTGHELFNQVSKVMEQEFLRRWKIAVVANPRYVLRVPLFDEQLRFFADLTVMDRVWASKLWSRASRHLPIPQKMMDMRIPIWQHERVIAGVERAGFKDPTQAIEAIGMSNRVGGDFVDGRLGQLSPYVRRLLDDSIAAGTEAAQETVYGMSRVDFIRQYDNTKKGLIPRPTRGGKISTTRHVSARQLEFMDPTDLPDEVRNVATARTRKGSELKAQELYTQDLESDLERIGANEGGPGNPAYDDTAVEVEEARRRTEELQREFDELKDDPGKIFDWLMEQGRGKGSYEWWQNFGGMGLRDGRQAYAFTSRNLGGRIYVNLDPEIWDKGRHPFEWQMRSSERLNGPAFQKDIVGDNVHANIAMTVDHEQGHVAWYKLDNRLGDDYRQALTDSGFTEVQLRDWELEAAQKRIDDLRAQHAKAKTPAGKAIFQDQIDQEVNEMARTRNTPSTVDGIVHEFFADMWAIYKQDPALLDEMDQLGNGSQSLRRFFEENEHDIGRVIDGQGQDVVYLDPSPPNPNEIVVQVPNVRPGDKLDDMGSNSGGAADFFSSQRTKEESLRRSLARGTKMGTHYYGRVNPGEARYMDTLEKVLRNDVRRSVHGQIILQGMMEGEGDSLIMKRLAEYWDTGPGMRNAGRMGWRPEDMLEKSDALVDSVRKWIGNDPRIAEALLDNRAEARRMLEDAFDSGAINHPVHGFAAKEVLDDNNIVGKIFNRYTRAILELPTNRLARQPFFKAWHGKISEGLFALAKEQGLDISDMAVRRAIDGGATEFARNRVLDVMFDFRKNYKFAEMAQWIAPFMQPWMEAFTVWSGLLRNNPAFAARATILGREAIDNGFFERDEITGEYRFPLTQFLMGGPMLSAIFNNSGNADDMPGWSLSGPVRSFNFFFGSVFNVPVGDSSIPIPTPGLSPPLTWVAQKLASSDILPEYAKYPAIQWAYEYGSVQGFENAATSLLPTWAGRLVDSFINEDMINSTSVDFLRLYQSRGMTVDSIAKSRGITSAEAEKFLAQRAINDAKELIRYKAWFSWVMPVAPTVNFPTAELEDEFRSMVDENDDFLAGIKQFEAKYGDKYSYLSEASTVWLKAGGLVPIPANEAVEKLMMEPGFEQFAQRYPRWAFALIPQEHWDDPFERAVFFRQMDAGWRRAKGPLEFLQDTETSDGWEAYFAAKESYDAKLEKYLSTPGSSEVDAPALALGEAFDGEVEELAAQFPTWGKDHNEINLQGIDPYVLQEARGMMHVPAFVKTDVGQGLKAYLLLRQQTKKQMAPHNIQSLTTMTATDLGIDKFYQDGVERIIADHPQFEFVYNTMFRNDFKNEGLVTTAGEKWLNNYNEKWTPEQRNKFEQWQMEWNATKDAADEAADNPGEAALAYIKLREMTQHQFDKAPWGDDQNFVYGWWQTRQPDDRVTATNSIATRPYVFLSRFDRGEVLKENTDDKTEEQWLNLGNYMAETSRLNAERPGMDLGHRYDRQNQIARRYAATNPVFRAQLEHANEWGWGYRQVNKEVFKESTPRGEAWRGFYSTLANLQHQVIRRDIHSVDSPDPKEAVAYEQLRLVLERKVEELKKESTKFKNDWEALNTGSGYALEKFFPETWFLLGGHF